MPTRQERHPSLLITMTKSNKSSSTKHLNGRPRRTKFYFMNCTANVLVGTAKVYIRSHSRPSFHTMNSADTESSFGVAIRASHTSSLNSFFGTSKGDKYAQDFYQSGRAGRCPPDNSAHISAHNAVRSADASRGPVSAYLRSRQEESLERNYQKAVKRAEKKGRTLPPRNDYYDHWGYSYFSTCHNPLFIFWPSTMMSKY